MKNLSKLGKALNKVEQKKIIGGLGNLCCLWCHDGCRMWVSGKVDCPFVGDC